MPVSAGTARVFLRDAGAVTSRNCLAVRYDGIFTGIFFLFYTQVFRPEEAVYAFFHFYKTKE
jgi:hypothetical protein